MRQVWKPTALALGLAIAAGCGGNENTVEAPKEFAPRPTEPPTGGMMSKPKPGNASKHDNVPSETN